MMKTRFPTRSTYVVRENITLKWKPWYRYMSVLYSILLLPTPLFSLKILRI